MPSLLEQRAEQARIDYERADRFDRFDRDVQRKKAKPPSVPDPSPPIPSRFVLVCIDCDYSIYLDSAKPRLPLCQRCRVKREDRKMNRRRWRAAERRKKQEARRVS